MKLIQPVLIILTLLLAGCASSVQPPSPPMISFPAGSFVMGDDTLGDPDESPAHVVSLAAFSIDQFEVSNEQYALCVDAGECKPPSSTGSEFRTTYFADPEFANYPVIFVTWQDASSFCEWRDARLPTEAEWEYAARGSESLIFPWGNQFDPRLLNYCDIDCGLPWADLNYNDGFPDTAPIDAFPEGATPAGVHNMSGNVWEWVADWYSQSYYQHADPSNPEGPASGTQRVTRGGGFVNDPFYLRTSVRRRFTPDVTSSSLGFRCAK